MPSVGSYLRELRTRRGVSLEEISRSTRVLTSYLEALEADDFDALPAPVFTRGFIRAYCQTLGVAPDEAFAIYDGRAVDAPETKTTPEPHARPAGAAATAEAARRRETAETRSRSAVLAGFVLLVVLGVALFTVTLWLQPAREPRREERAAARAPEPRPAPDVEARPAAETPRPVPAPAMPGPPAGASTGAPPQIAGVTSLYRLVARTSELTWIRVRTQDGRTSEENIPAGETREWVSNRPFILTIGNAGGVAFELNGRPVPRLGPSGAVIERLVLPADVP